MNDGAMNFFGGCCEGGEDDGGEAGDGVGAAGGGMERVADGLDIVADSCSGVVAGSGFGVVAET